MLVNNETVICNNCNRRGLKRTAEDGRGEEDFRGQQRMAEEKRILEDSRRLQRIVEGSRGYD